MTRAAGHRPSTKRDRLRANMDGELASSCNPSPHPSLSPSPGPSHGPGPGHSPSPSPGSTVCAPEWGEPLDRVPLPLCRKLGLGLGLELGLGLVLALGLALALASALGKLS